MAKLPLIVQSKSCPFCAKITDVRMTRDQHRRLMAYYAGNEPIQEWLPDFDADTRELFITGICSFCWDSNLQEQERIEEEDDA